MFVHISVHVHVHVCTCFIINEVALKCRILATNELLSVHECMFGTNNTRFMQAKAVHREERYCWTRVHTFSDSFLRA